MVRSENIEGEAGYADRPAPSREQPEFAPERMILFGFHDERQGRAMRSVEGGAGGGIQQFLVLDFPEMSCVVDGGLDAFAEQRGNVRHGDVEGVLAQDLERVGRERCAQALPGFPCLLYPSDAADE